MTELGFYHLTRSRLEEALPKLLEKVLAAGHRVVLRAGEEDRLDHLDRALWTYSNDSFLPHGRRADGRASEQPVFLTTEIENPNAAGVLVLVDAAPADDLASFERGLELFDGDDADQLAAARRRWTWALAAGHLCTYWQQGERGGWMKAREAGGPSSPTEAPL